MTTLEIILVVVFGVILIAIIIAAFGRKKIRRPTKIHALYPGFESHFAERVP